MSLFLGTLMVFALCGLGLGLGVLLGGAPLQGGCGRSVPRCADCPGRNRARPDECARQGFGPSPGERSAAETDREHNT